MTRSAYFALVLTLSVFLLSSCAASRKAKVREHKINLVIGKAKSYIGTPYKYGGKTRSGMDCSGLLLNSFNTISYKLPRTSDDQSKIGNKVKMGKLEPGDLVFFATGKKKRRITHVGLVTQVEKSGSVKFIHASSSKGVIESDLYSTYYKKRYVTARRPL